MHTYALQNNSLLGLGEWAGVPGMTPREMILQIYSGPDGRVYSPGSVWENKYLQAEQEFKSGKISEQEFIERFANIDATVLYYHNPEKKANMGLTFAAAVAAFIKGALTGNPIAAFTASAAVILAKAKAEEIAADQGIQRIKNEILKQQAEKQRKEKTSKIALVGIGAFIVLGTTYWILK